MYFRQSGARGSRRRRVLSDLLLWNNTKPRRRTTRRATSRSRGGRTLRSTNYGNAEFLDEQPRLTELVPTRITVFFLVFLAGLGGIGGMVGLYAWSHRLAESHPMARVTAFDLQSPGNLAAWFSSMLFAAAAVGAYLTYSVRRFRIDDYHGRYRVWLWAALCWLLLSVDRIAHLRHAFRDLMVTLTGAPLYGDGAIWWLALYLFLLGGVGLRVLIDARRCTGSAGLLVLCAACYIAAVVNKFGGIPVQDAVQAVVIREGAILLGSFFLFLAMGLQARYVLLDATGLLPHDYYGRENAWGNGESLVVLADRSLAVHSGHSSPRTTSGVTPMVVQEVTPVSAASLGMSEPTVVSTTPAVIVNPPVNRKLTKEERRRLQEKLGQIRESRNG